MAKAIHELWMNNDPSLMIMPGSMAVGSADVESELLHYLEDRWESIIAGDIDGLESIPYRIDRSAPNLNRCSATRRVARALFMGTAPTHKENNRGLDDKRINLGVVQPGERPSVFGDALRRLGNQARFLHADLGRYWYSMSASLNRLAADRAEQVEEALVLSEIDRSLATYINDLRDRGHFDTVQVAPGNSADVPDEAGGVRAIVFGISRSHNGRDASEASIAAREILMQRGSAPRVYRNVLVFLAAETRQLDNLKEAMRAALAWNGIVRETQRLNLTQSDSALAKQKLAEANATVKTRLTEAWCYLLYPRQESAEADTTWISGKVPARDGLLGRASKRLVDEEGLLPALGPGRLDRDLQRYIWRDKPHLYLKDLQEYLGRYTYLPRLKNRSVLVNAVTTAIGGMLPGPFAYAESWDEATGTYRGLAIDNMTGVQVVIDDESLIVRPDIAEAHRPRPERSSHEIDSPRPSGNATPGLSRNDGGSQTPGGDIDPTGNSSQTTLTRPTRFMGTAIVSPERPVRDMNRIIEAVVEQLTSLPDSEVNLKIEIDAEVPSGLDDAKVRTLIENANTLGFIEKTIR